MPSITMIVKEGPKRPSPWTRQTDEKALLFVGKSDTDYVCGTCFQTLMKSLKVGTFHASGMYECGTCGTTNVMPECKKANRRPHQPGRRVL